MIKYLNCSNYKAIDKITLSNLGKINVLCGKNNSGKSSIFEALCNDKHFGIGKLVEDTNWLISLFKSQADRYTNPDPSTSLNNFSVIINGEIINKSVWYSNEIDNIIKRISASFFSSLYFRNFSRDIYNFRPTVLNFFSKSIEQYKPILIPPKRKLTHKVNINLDEPVSPDGNGVVNKIFFLKNQDLESEDYKCFLNIYNTFNDITGLKFNIFPNPQNEIILYFTNDAGEWIESDYCGLGLSDILIIISVIFIMNSSFIFLEEPENHLHAEYQKNLLSFISKIKGKQFFISTHSSIFLDVSLVDKIFHCTNNNGINISDQTSKSELISSLGYSVAENLVSDLIILTEGPSDIPILKSIFKWVDLTDQFNIKFWPLGGDIMSDLDLSVFAERNNIFALIDSDPGSSVQRTRFIKNCKSLNLKCHRLKRYSIENYFSIEAIKKVFPGQISDKIKELLPDKSVDEQIGFKAKSKSIKGKNYKIICEMKLSDLEGTDLLEFIQKIKNYLLQSRCNK